MTLWCLFGLPWALAGDPQVAEPVAEEEVVVRGHHHDEASSTTRLDRAAVEAMPARSADDLLRAMPGLHASAHGGHGKAYQYFLRGFDAVHGADLAVDIDDVPVNELSHVHAHGYLDLHLLPTMLVRGVDLHPGSARVDAGDFAIAGSGSFQLGLDDAGGLLQVGLGTDGSGQALLTWRPKHSSPGTFLLANADVGVGVGASRAWRQLRGGAGVQGSLGDIQVRAWLLGYDGDFESPGVLREADVTSGEVTFYDAYPGSGGGHSSRVLGSVQAWGGDRRHVWRVTGWAGWRGFRLDQNFTGWYDDLQHGDATRQTHHTWSGGAGLRSSWVPHARVAVQSGLTARLDAFHQGEQAIDSHGVVWEERADRVAQQSDLEAWAGARVGVTPWLTVEPGLRGALFLVHLAGQHTSWAPVLAPKLSVVLFDEAPVTGFLAYGRGYRSPDARGTGDGGRAPVAVADSFEAGLSARPLPAIFLRGASFATLVSDEIVFDHVAARYLATGSTRRLGVYGNVTVRPADGLRLEAELTWSDGRYTSTGAPVPYAPKLLVVAGAYAERLRLGRATCMGGLRAWVLGPRPLPGAFSSHTAVVADWTSAVDIDDWRLSFQIDNLFGAHWRDGEFVFASNWHPSEPRSELPVRHFTAGAPRAARIALGRRF